MSRVRIALALLAVCGPIVAIGVANAVKGPGTQAQPIMPAQPDPATRTAVDLQDEAVRALQPPSHTLPPQAQVPTSGVLPGCPGDPQNVLSTHLMVGGLPDYYARGKALGMTDDEARAYLERMESAGQTLVNQMLARVPPPPC